MLLRLSVPQTHRSAITILLQSYLVFHMRKLNTSDALEFFSNTVSLSIMAFCVLVLTAELIKL